MESKICSSSSDYVLKEYHEAKAELEQIHDYITEGIILHSRSTWYNKKGKKSTKHFLTLEKCQKSKTFVKRLISRETEFSDYRDISFTIRKFYTNLFSRKSVMTVQDCVAFLDTLDMSLSSGIREGICEGMINVIECFNCLQSMHSNKTPRNDGITHEFYIAFFDLIEDLLMSSINHSWEVGELSTSQKQVVITLIEKKGKDKRYIQSWRPISLQNVDAKIISKVLAMCLKKVIDKVIRPDQTAYIPGRFIGKSIRLISDILECTEVEEMEGYMFAADIEKAFDLVDHNFLIAVLKKFGLGHKFIQWVKTLLYDQQSCVMINGHSTGSFALKRGSRQGDLLSAFLFLLTIEVLFIMIRSNVNIKGLNIFENEIKYIACADDTTLFLRDLRSFFELLSLFQIFESWSSLKLNLNKSELCGIGIKKGVNLAFCGCKVVNLGKETVKILGAHFSYNMSLVDSRNFVETISKMEEISVNLVIWSFDFNRENKCF